MKQQSPLNQIDLSTLQNGTALHVTEAPFLGYVVLRADPMNKTLYGLLESALGMELPIKPNTCVSSTSNVSGVLDVLWYGPSEWLVVTKNQNSAVDIVRGLRVGFGDQHASATEITGGNTMLQIFGESARNLLAKATPLDLHHSVFKVGDCAQTVFAKAGATLYLSDDAKTFKVIIRRSFADYVGVWLLDAAQEFLSV